MREERKRRAKNEREESAGLRGASKGEREPNVGRASVEREASKGRRGRIERREGRGRIRVHSIKFIRVRPRRSNKHRSVTNELWQIITE